MACASGPAGPPAGPVTNKFPPPPPKPHVRGCCCAYAPAPLLWLRLSLRGRRRRICHHAAPPPSPPQGHVFIKRANDAPADEVFAKLTVHAGDFVADLAERACTKFGWGVPTQMRLYLVPHAGKENPTADAETSAKALDKPAYSLADAGIASGSWLLARVSQPAAADGESCGARPRLLGLGLMRSVVHELLRRAPPPPPSCAADMPPPWAGPLIAGMRALQLRAEASDALDEASAATPADYEEAGRRYLRDNFERLFGLRILEAARIQRAEGEITTPSGASCEWDFRVPVNVSGSPTFAKSPEAGCLIYLDHERYLRPARSDRARELTTTKLPSGIAAASDFMAVFEITTAKRWPTSLLARLEQRLVVSLDRARALNPDAELGILDVVAIVGVLGTGACQVSVSTRLAKRAEMPLLREMANAARFVFLLRPLAL